MVSSLQWPLPGTSVSPSGTDGENEAQKLEATCPEFPRDSGRCLSWAVLGARWAVSPRLPWMAQQLPPREIRPQFLQLKERCQRDTSRTSEAGPGAGVCGQVSEFQAVPEPTPRCPRQALRQRLWVEAFRSPPWRAGLDSGRHIPWSSRCPQTWQAAPPSHRASMWQKQDSNPAQPNSRAKASGEFQSVQGFSLPASQESPCPQARAHIFRSHIFPVSSGRVIIHLLFALLHFQGREMCPEGEKFRVNFLFPGSPNPGSATRCLAPVPLAALLPFPVVWRAAEMSSEKPGAAGVCVLHPEQVDSSTSHVLGGLG